MGASQSQHYPPGEEPPTSITDMVTGFICSASSYLLGYPLYFTGAAAYGLASIPLSFVYQPKYKYRMDVDSLDLQVMGKGRRCFISGPLDEFGDHLAWWFSIVNFFKYPPCLVDRTEFSKTEFLIRFKTEFYVGQTFFISYDRNESKLFSRNWEEDGSEGWRGFWTLYKDPVRVEFSSIMPGKRHNGDAVVQRLREGFETVQKSMGRAVTAREININGFVISPSHPYRSYSTHPAASTEPLNNHLGDDWDRLIYEWLLYEVNTGRVPNKLYQKEWTEVLPDMDSPSGNGEKSCLSGPLDLWITCERFMTEVLSAIKCPGENLGKLKHCEVKDISDKEFVVYTEWDMANLETHTTKTQQRVTYDFEKLEISIELSNPKSKMCYLLHRNPFVVEAWGEVGGQRMSGQITSKVVQDTLDRIIDRVLKEKGPNHFPFNSEKDHREICAGIMSLPYAEFSVFQIESPHPPCEEVQANSYFNLLSWRAKSHQRFNPKGSKGAVVNLVLDRYRSEIVSEVKYMGETIASHKWYTKFHKTPEGVIFIESWWQERDQPVPSLIQEPLFNMVVGSCIEKFDARKSKLIPINT